MIIVSHPLARITSFQTLHVYHVLHLIFLVFSINRLGGDFISYPLFLCFCLFWCFRVESSLDASLCSGQSFGSSRTATWSQELATPLGILDFGFRFGFSLLAWFFTFCLPYYAYPCLNFCMMLHYMPFVWWMFICARMLCHHTSTCHASCLLTCVVTHKIGMSMHDAKAHMHRPMRGHW